ncbi:helix-turn-helix domain-containing protein [Streptomyces sp. SCL15-6]|uniref:helix-turn-helix domain-containing protein n=1 Tax=Streptomyces sp. SCL15-6 TaxID=2967222 RepID=UPI002966D8B8|nr:helix-turn-helix domain-containing protein [Streptomyces sp. SCL15-6]
MTIANLVRLGPDGQDSVRTGLKELEAHGYLIRERLRRPDGTLGEIAYCITDRPAALDLALIEAGLAIASPGVGQAGEFPAGIRRGVMAADQFTRIANGLFRTSQLSFKAKGLFGLLSTHREGWRMTVADIARRSRDGESAVKSALKELEKHGYLVRKRERASDGTLGAAAYVLTDLPVLQKSTSQPESDSPPVDEPTLADHPTKNTNRKNTTQQKTRPLPPRARSARPRHQALPAPRTAPPPADLEPGVRLLLAIGAQHPALLLTGKVLTEQGRTVTEMLDAGWTREQLSTSSATAPCRIRSAPPSARSSPPGSVPPRPTRRPPPTVAGHHDTPTWNDPPTQSSTSAAARTVDEALTYRALVECTGCGLPGTVRGQDLCPACLGWPTCRTCPGPTPRRAHPDGDGRCTTCASTFIDCLEGSSL